MPKMQVAVQACVKRYYRLYVEVPDGASNATIRETAKNMIAGISTEELEKYADQELTVETYDVDWLRVDEESIPALN